ncbi:MAG: aminopeptidase N [Micavibrio sp.]
MSESGKVMYLKDYRAPDYRVKHVDLEFDIQDGETFVTATMQVERNGKHNNPLVLDGTDLELLSVEIDGQPLGPNGYTLSDTSLTLQPPEHSTIKTRVRIKPEDNTALEGLYKSGPLYCTQCEATGFRRITYFIDRPDNMATYTTKIIADKKTAPVLLSNGNKIDEGTMPDGRGFTLWSDPFPKPCYLFAVVAGELDVLEDHFTTMSGRDVTLRVWAESKDLDKLNHSMECLKAAMKWDEQVYGREYDLDLFNIVAVSYFNMGAMENKSLNIFNTKCVLANPKTQTDADFKSVDRVVPHEYFHNWTGNRVTCRDWFQLTLKEGLTVFRDQEYSASRGSRVIQRIGDVAALRAAQFPVDAGPLAHPIRIEKAESVNNFYTTTIYEKGAEVIRMIHTLLGESGFRAGTDLYFQRHDGQAVTCDDFIKAMGDATGRDFSQFMLWYSQAGTPVIDASWSYNPTAQKFFLTLKQTIPPTPGQPVKKPMHIPVRFGLVTPAGQDAVLNTATGATETLLELTQDSQTFEFDNIPPGCVPSLLRNFSAPVRLNAPYTDGQLRHLMSYDSDGFNQWDAGNRYLRHKILEQIDRVETGKKLVVDKDVTDTLRQLAAQPGNDPQLLAAMLTLPSTADLEQARPVIDPLAVAKVHNAFSRKIATTLRGELAAIYDGNNDVGQPYRMDQKSLGRRVLMNAALSYLTRTPERQDFQRALDQYAKASHMTDQASALRALLGNKVARPADTKNALDRFYNDFRSEALVIDKWFSLQAASGSLKTAQALRQHPDFDIKSPNRVRALYSTFMYSNPTAFHAKDGSGYKFVADFIAGIDAGNPQLASRLLDGFADVEKYKEPHRRLMKDALQGIADSLGAKASPDLAEKLGKFGVRGNTGSGAAKPSGTAPAP